MTPILLFNGECQACRRIAHWVETSARRGAGSPAIVVQAIGEDPAALRRFYPGLDIWEAYAAPHVLMADGSMKRAGEAVAEVFRRLPNTRWFAGIFALRVFGARPFQAMLDAAYAVLADLRPLLGCDSCGAPRPWVSPLVWLVNRAKSLVHPPRPARLPPHFTARPRHGI